MTERTPKDFAIEHGEYLAVGAEHLIDSINALHYAVEMEYSEDEIAKAQEAADEARTALRVDIYEFRKRRTRALAAPSQPEGAKPRIPVVERGEAPIAVVRHPGFGKMPIAEWLGRVPIGAKLYLHPSQSAGAAAPDEGADDPLAKAILKGLTSKQLRDKALYLMALNANQARTIDALQADKYCSQCRKTKGADPALGADLHKFMDAAAGEGLVLDGVDAADLYVKLFPAEYAALSAPKGEAATPASPTSAEGKP